MSTPMKIPRTTNEKYAIIRAEEEEQRKRKTSVKREATVLPVCRRVMLGPDVAIQTIQIPCGDTSFPHTPLPGSNYTPLPGSNYTPLPGSNYTPLPGSNSTPLPGNNSTPSATTPHARPFESQPNSPW